MLAPFEDGSSGLLVDAVLSRHIHAIAHQIDPGAVFLCLFWSATVSFPVSYSRSFSRVLDTAFSFALARALLLSFSRARVCVLVVVSPPFL